MHIIASSCSIYPCTVVLSYWILKLLDQNSIALLLISHCSLRKHCFVTDDQIVNNVPLLSIQSYRALQSVPRRHNTFYNSTEFRVHELNKRLQQRTEVCFIFWVCYSFQILNNLHALKIIYFVGKWQLLVGCFCDWVFWRWRITYTHILFRRWAKAI